MCRQVMGARGKVGAGPEVAGWPGEIEAEIVFTFVDETPQGVGAERPFESQRVAIGGGKPMEGSPAQRGLGFAEGDQFLIEGQQIEVRIAGAWGRDIHAK